MWDYSLIKGLSAAVICGQYLWLKSSQFIIDIYTLYARMSNVPPIAIATSFSVLIES